MEVRRIRWDFRLIFLFAAIGSAVGLGNLWRFPYLTYKFGGGAFLIPYLIVLLLIGVPLMILEFALGQKMQKGVVGAFGRINRGFTGVGFMAVFVCFVVAAYYAVVMGWSLVYMLGSFHSPLPWSVEPEKFFSNNVLQLTKNPGEIGSFSTALIIALAAVWAAIFFCVFRGAKSIGKAVFVSMPLPFIILLILFLRAVTLDGALAGISYYISPDFSLLLSGELWLAAITQVFFSLSLGLGVMVAYGSFNNPRQGITRNALVVVLASAGFSLLAGFVVFGILGHMALVQNVAIEKVAVAGPSLAFVVLPQALSLIPFSGVFSFIFFLALFTLALDSAFSFVEGIAAVIRDRWRRIPTMLVSFVICGCGFLFGLFLTAGAGFYFLDIMDHYVSTYLLVLVGILQCIIVGWVYGAGRMRTYANAVSVMKIGRWWDVCIKWVVPVSLGVLVMAQLISDIRTPYQGYPGWAQAVGWGTIIAVLAAAVLMALMPARASGSAAKP